MSDSTLEQIKALLLKIVPCWGCHGNQHVLCDGLCPCPCSKPFQPSPQPKPKVPDSICPVLYCKCNCHQPTPEPYHTYPDCLQDGCKFCRTSSELSAMKPTPEAPRCGCGNYVPCPNHKEPTPETPKCNCFCHISLSVASSCQNCRDRHLPPERKCRLGCDPKTESCEECACLSGRDCRCKIHSSHDGCLPTDRKPDEVARLASEIAVGITGWCMPTDKFSADINAQWLADKLVALVKRTGDAGEGK